jgi:integrase
MSIRDERLPEMRSRLASFKENIVDGIRVKSTPMREGLTEEEEPIFLKAITPGDVTNPFEPRNHVRNHALWLTYYKAGLRLGEGLGLKTIDCHLNGRQKKLIVHRRPDDPDDPRRSRRSPRRCRIPSSSMIILPASSMISSCTIAPRTGVRNAARTSSSPNAAAL